jgi:hypothetical protein
VRKERVRVGEGICTFVLHAATWFLLLPLCFQLALTLEAPPSLPKRPLSAGYFRPAGPGEIRFYTNVNPDRGFVLDILANDAQRVSSFDETVTTNEAVTSDDSTVAQAALFSDPLVSERLTPPLWLTAFAGLLSDLLRHLRAAYFAGTSPWLFAAAPCFPLSALVVLTHLSRRRFANLCRVVFTFLLILGGNIAWVHFDLDTLLYPVTDSLNALFSAALPLQNVKPTLAIINLLLALALYCHGFVGTKANKRRENTAEAFT